MIEDLKQNLNALKDRKSELEKEIGSYEDILINVFHTIPKLSIVKLLLKREKIKELKAVKHQLKQKINEFNLVIDNIGKLQDKIREETTQNIYMTIGIIGSGKSTWTAKKFEENNDNGIKTIIVNKDGIREMLYGKYDYDADKEDIVRNIAWDVVRRGVEYGYDVIIDETNITIEKRRQWVDYIRMIFGYNVKIIYVNCPERERNLRFRKEGGLRDVPESRWENLIKFMIEDFQPITKEGQNEVIEYVIPNIEL